MEKITSFTIDHNKLQPGVYVSRKDQVEGGMVTTFDLRMTSPNEEPVMNTAEMHTIEHLGGNLFKESRHLWQKVHLLRTHGVQDRFLSASGRGLPVRGYPAPDGGNV